MAVGVERVKPLAGRVVLTETTTELNRYVFLDLFGLIDPEHPKVVVLELFRIIKREAMDARTVPKLHVQIGFVVLADAGLGYPMPTPWCVVAVEEHIPRRGSKLGTRLTRDNAIGAWILAEGSEDLHTASGRLAVTP